MYYFVSYTVRRIGRSEWHFANDLISEDPIRWIVDYGKNSSDEEVVLISYHEITSEQYDLYSGWIG